MVCVRRSARGSRAGSAGHPRRRAARGGQQRRLMSGTRAWRAEGRCVPTTATRQARPQRGPARARRAPARRRRGRPADRRQPRHDHPHDPDMWVLHQTIYLVAVRPGPPCAPAGAPPAQRAGLSPTGRARTTERRVAGHGPAQRAAGRGRGSGGPRPLGGRPHHRQWPIARRSARSSSGRPATSCSSPCRRADGRRGRAALVAIPTLPEQLRRLAHLGPRQRRWPSMSGSPSTPASRFLQFPRPGQPLAARHQREHQRPAAPVYFPKGTDLLVHDQAHLDAVAQESTAGLDRRSAGSSEALATLLRSTV